MIFPQKLYHLYNRGNNRERIFYIENNYHYFIRKVKKYLLPHTEILAFCLMPNHFHFLLYTKSDFVREDYSGSLRVMLSSYTRGINKQERRVGSLFQQNTKTKELDSDQYASNCFHYIHQNPMKAGLVSRMEDYQWSSFREYAGLPCTNICNTELAEMIIQIPPGSNFIEESNQIQEFDYRIE